MIHDPAFISFDALFTHYSKKPSQLCNDLKSCVSLSFCFPFDATIALNDAGEGVDTEQTACEIGRQIPLIMANFIYTIFLFAGHITSRHI